MLLAQYRAAVAKGELRADAALLARIRHRARHRLQDADFHGRALCAQHGRYGKCSRPERGRGKEPAAAQRTQ